MNLARFLYNLVAACGLLIMAGQAFAGGPPEHEPEIYQLKYQVKRDGSPIGTYSFDIRESRDSYNFEARLDIDVSILGFTVYELTHRRSEQWRNGRLVTLKGRSVYDDGERYKINLQVKSGQTYRLNVNGDTQQVNGRVISFSPRQPGEWDKARLISLKGDAEAVTRRKLEPEQLTVKGKRYRAAHYRLKGDIKRDLWYDDEGRLLKLSYKKDGATITFVRTGIAKVD